MRKPQVLALVVLADLLCSARPASATPISSCNSDFSYCAVYESATPFSLTGLAISGDVILTNPATDAVFTIFNDVADTGGGTGLGTLAQLFTANLNNLPDPANFSANAVFVTEGTTLPSSFTPSPVSGYVETDYAAQSTVFSFYTIPVAVATPEPSGFALLGFGLGLLWMLGTLHSQRRSAANRA